MVAAAAVAQSHSRWSSPRPCVPLVGRSARHRNRSRRRAHCRQRRRSSRAADRSRRCVVAVGQRTVLRAHRARRNRRALARVHRRWVRRAADRRRIKRLHRERRRAVRHLAGLHALRHMALHRVASPAPRPWCPRSPSPTFPDHAAVRRPGIGRRLLRVQVQRRRPSPSPGRPDRRSPAQPSSCTSPVAAERCGRSASQSRCSVPPHSDWRARPGSRSSECPHRDRNQREYSDSRPRRHARPKRLSQNGRFIVHAAAGRQPNPPLVGFMLVKGREIAVRPAQPRGAHQPMPEQSEVHPREGGRSGPRKSPTSHRSRRSGGR